MITNPVFSAKVLDANVQYYGFSILQLMESAGRAIAKELEKDFGVGNKIAVFCGTGNNAGDGLVAARYLSANNEVTVYLVGRPEQIKSKETLRNFVILKNSFVELYTFPDSKELPERIDADIILECLVGTGLSGSLREPLKSAVVLLNRSKATKISVDIPCPSFKADKVYSIATKKVNDASVLDIGVPKEFYYFTGPGNVKFLTTRKSKSHKGQNGIVLIVAGSKRYHGASIFAGRACSLFSDLIFFLTEKENIPYVKKASPEFIVSEFTLKNIKENLPKADAILIGPGLNPSSRTAHMLNTTLSRFSSKKFVLDAGAFNILRKKKLHKNCILTPHSTEFKKLFNCNPNPSNVLAMANKFNCNIALKGPVDYISDGNALYCNFSGNALLTAGGTGDVLAGVLTAFASQNPLLDSALAACFLVGFAADIIASKESGLNASRLIEELPKAKKLCENFG